MRFNPLVIFLESLKGKSQAGIAIGLFGLGISLVIPNLLGLVFLKETASSGWALGVQSSFSGVEQIISLLAGTAIYSLNGKAPFYTTGGLLVITALIQFKNHKSIKNEKS